MDKKLQLIYTLWQIGCPLLGLATGMIDGEPMGFWFRVLFIPYCFLGLGLLSYNLWRASKNNE